jgi:hypothetical protein
MKGETMDPNQPLTLHDLLNHAEVFHNDEPQSTWDAANREMERLIKKAIVSRKPTELVIALKFAPNPATGNVSIVAKLTGKEPAHIPLPFPVFTDSRGRIFNEDPRQPPLGFDQDQPANVHPINAKGA